MYDSTTNATAKQLVELMVSKHAQKDELTLAEGESIERFLLGTDDDTRMYVLKNTPHRMFMNLLVATTQELAVVYNDMLKQPKYLQEFKYD